MAHIFRYLQLYICSLACLLLNLVNTLMVEFKECFCYGNLVLKNLAFVSKEPLLLTSKLKNDGSFFKG